MKCRRALDEQRILAAVANRMGWYKGWEPH
jgi:hypothetical protein